MSPENHVSCFRCAHSISSVFLTTFGICFTFLLYIITGAIILFSFETSLETSEPNEVWSLLLSEQHQCKPFKTTWYIDVRGNGDFFFSILPSYTRNILENNRVQNAEKLSSQLFTCASFLLLQLFKNLCNMWSIWIHRFALKLQTLIFIESLNGWNGVRASKWTVHHAALHNILLNWIISHMIDKLNERL